MVEAAYEPSPWDWVKDQVEKIESSGGTEGTTLMETGWSVIVVTMIGVKTGAIRKVPLMRVEHAGEYAVIGSIGGAPENPKWVANVRANPNVAIQDGPDKRDYVLRELPEGDERATWWGRAVEAYPPYAEYQEKTDRRIPVFIAAPVAP
ncbi:MAG: nitroreductase family deazaflavin-dependent oxidoreductase [Acidimicrobiales bacterium]|nr:nitroreductase family deazaflavin-dependent oxidoreductase [Acidimicrobiales bacterium]